MLVAIDPGHGGSDPGAVYQGRQEKDDNLRLALAVGKILEQRGVDVVYTRTDDIYETPFKKATDANEAGADYFISFHRNSSETPGANGVQTLVYNDSGVKSILARNINDELVKFGFKDLGIDARPNLVVLKRTNMPAVLIETGFINNARDNQIFDDNFNEIADAIADGILETIGYGESSAVSAKPVNNGNVVDQDDMSNDSMMDQNGTMDDNMMDQNRMNDNMMDQNRMNDNMMDQNGMMNRNMTDQNNMMNRNMTDQNNMMNRNMTDQNNMMNRNMTDQNDMMNGNFTDQNGILNGNFTNQNGMMNGDMTDQNGMMNGNMTDQNGFMNGNLINQNRGMNPGNRSNPMDRNEQCRKIYRVQVGAYRNKESAERLLNSLIADGFPAFMIYDDGLYKVQVGAYKLLDNAIRMESRLRRYRYNTFITI